MDTLSLRQTVSGDRQALAAGFFFMSPFRSFATRGCFSRISTCARDGHQPEGALQCELREHFSRARRAGIKRPVVVGAIPFDVGQPAELFIPQTCYPFDRKALLHRSTDGSPLPQVTGKIECPLRPEFTRMVAQAVAAIRQGQLSKVVLSRLLEITTGEPVDISALLGRLISQNPNGYNFHVPLADGALLGASPELLLRKISRRFYSMPLAGSARRDACPERDAANGHQLQASSKDRYEHQLVIAQMRQVLAPRSEALQVPPTPGLVNTPTLWHLATAIEGRVVDLQENALSLACLLHPTPALCGAPTDPARRLIQSLEPFDRGLFGGMVGWCDDQGDGEWVVTIRCGKVTGNQVRLFAGAGIVPDSTPEAEWRETGVKLDTMLHAFGLQ